MIDVPFLSYEELKRSAQATLDKSSRACNCPVNIEMIVEQDFEIEIVPFRGLKDRFSIDAFISHDFNTITVDEYVLENRLNRYRFSLAHELGHRVLHKSIFAPLTFPTIQAWKSCIGQIPEREYGFLEYQANTFANCLLLPAAELELHFRQAVEQIRQAGLDPQKNPDVCMDYISTGLGKEFQVSREAVLNRLNNKNEEFRF